MVPGDEPKKIKKIKFHNEIRMPICPLHLEFSNKLDDIYKVVQRIEKREAYQKGAESEKKKQEDNKVTKRQRMERLKDAVIGGVLTGVFIFILIEALKWTPYF